jgi:hypothetical protein
MGETDDFSIGGYDINSVSVTGLNTVDIILVTSGSADTDVTPDITLKNNQIGDGVVAIASNQTFTNTQDGAGPAIVAAETDDTNGNGQIDLITVTFSEIIDDGTVDQNASGGFDDFSVADSYVILDVNASAGSNEVSLIITEKTAPDTDVEPDVILTVGEVEDLLNNTIVDGNQNFTGTEDRAAPVIVESLTLDTDADGDVDRIEFRVSEDINDGSGVSFYITPPATFGATENSGTFDTEVTTIATFDIANDNYFSLIYNVDTWGTGVFTSEYVTGEATEVSDKTGNLNPLSNGPSGFITLVDGAAPRVVDVNPAGGSDLTPNDNETDVSSGNTISLKYSEQVFWETNNKIDFVQLAPILVTTYNDVDNTGLVDFSEVNGTVTITIPYFTNTNSDYYTIFPEGTFVDAANNTSADQFSSATAWNFTTETALVPTGSSVGVNQVIINLNASITSSTTNTASFTITDGLSQPIAVTGVTANNGTSQIVLNVDPIDLANAVGDFTINFDDALTTITASGTGTLETFLGFVVNADTDDPLFNPLVLPLTALGTNQVTLRFNEPVQNVAAVPGDFEVIDGAGEDFIVTSITDNVPNDNELELNFDVSDTPNDGSGDLFITYTDNVLNAGIQDFGSNQLDTETVQIELDNVDPELISFTVTLPNQIDLEFTEPVQIISASPANAFTVKDSLNNEYIVAALTDNVTNDQFLRLTTQNLENAYEDIFVTFNASAGLIIEDFGGNSFTSVTDPVRLDVNLNSVPTVTENFLGLDPNDNAGDDLSLVRTNVDPAIINSYTPITIYPQVDGHTITIYRDINQMDTLYIATGVSLATGVTPTLEDIFTLTPNPTEISLIDFANGNQHNGVFTIYIAETSTASPSTEGPSVAHTIALLDDVSVIDLESGSPTINTSFGEDNSTGVRISIFHPNNVTYTYSGDGLTQISYSPGAQSTARFVPSSAGTENSPHSIYLEMESNVSGESATFLTNVFAVNTFNTVFAPGADIDICRTEGPQILEINSSPSGIDVAETGLNNFDLDFYTIEVYYQLNGKIFEELGSDGSDEVVGAGNLDSLEFGGLQFIEYSGASLSLEEPSFTEDAWTINPEVLNSIFPDSITRPEIDTLLVYYIYSDAANNLQRISDEGEVYFFPDPIITLVNIGEGFDGTEAIVPLDTVGIFGSVEDFPTGDDDIYFCADDSPFELLFNVFTYTGDLDFYDPDIIENGYELYRQNEVGTYTLIADRTGSEIRFDFDPGEFPDGGSFRIIYESSEYTVAGCTNTEVADFSIFPKPSPERLTLTTDIGLAGIGGASGDLGLILDTLDNFTGATLPDGDSFDDDGVLETFYLLEFCDGDPLPKLKAGGVGDSVIWYDSFFQPIQFADNDTLDLSLTSIPTGPTRLYFQLVENGNINGSGFAGCFSDLRPVVVNIIPEPVNPFIIWNDSNIDDNNQQLVANDQETGTTTIQLDYCETDVLDELRFGLPINNVNLLDNPKNHLILIPESKNNADTVHTPNTVFDWTADLGFAGNRDTDTTVFIVFAVGDSIFAGGGPDAFAGCTSDTLRIDINVFGTPDDMLTTEQKPDPSFLTFNTAGELVPSVVTEYYTCEGDLFAPIRTNAIDEGDVVFAWYAAGDLTTVGSFITENDNFVTNNVYNVNTNTPRDQFATYRTDIDGTNGTVAPFDVSVVGTYYYWVTRTTDRDGGDGRSDFIGCESDPVLFSVTVFPDSEEPEIGVPQLVDGTAPVVGTNYAVFYCANDISGTDEFSALLQGFNDGAFSTASDGSLDELNSFHRFNWRNVNVNPVTGALNRQQNIIDLNEDNGSIALASELGLTGSAVDVTRIFNITQVIHRIDTVNEIDFTPVYDGCESNGFNVQVTVFSEPNVPVEAAFNNANRYCAGTPSNQIVDINAIGERGAIFKWYAPDAIVGFDDPLVTRSARDTSFTVGDTVGIVTVTGAELGIDETVPEGSILNYQVTQTADFDVTELIRNGFEVAPFVGCESQALIVPVEILELAGNTPIPKVTWEGITIGQPTRFVVTDEETNPSVTLNRVEVVIRDTVTNEVLFNSTFSDDLADKRIEFAYTFTTPGTAFEIDVFMFANSACNSEVERAVSILDHIVLSLDDFTDNVLGYDGTFEGSNGGWVVEYRALDRREDVREQFTDSGDPLFARWGLSTDELPSSNTAFDQSRYWVTNPGLNQPYADNENIGGGHTFIYSPSFDLSNIPSPSVQFDRWFEFDSRKDGVTLQYSLNNGRSWETLGEYDDILGASTGLSWYNAEAITIGPGTIGLTNPPETTVNESNVGWSDFDAEDGWQRAVNAFLETDKDSVRFRFVLSAEAGIKQDTEGNPADGFAFDNFGFLNRSKLVIMESFASLINQSSRDLNNELVVSYNDPLADVPLSEQDVVVLNYFIDFEGSGARDDFYLRNTTDPNARASIYGINEVPEIIISGTIDADSENEAVGPLIQSDSRFEFNIDNALLEEALFNIGGVSVSQAPDNPFKLTISADIVAKEDFNSSEEFTVHFAVIEPEVTLESPLGVYQANDVVLNLVRKLLPDASGFFVDVAGDPWNEAEARSFTYEWKATNLFSNQIRVVAFIQDFRTQQIFQSAISEVIVLPSDDDRALGIDNMKNLSIYPNPADESMTVEFPEVLMEETDWALYDQAGKQVLKGKLARGTRTQTIATEDLPSGIYLFHLLGAEETREMRRVVIVH